MILRHFGRLVLYVALPLGGFVLGAYFFSETRQRPLLTTVDCRVTNVCLNEKQLLGLFASIGLQKFPGALPGIVMETDKTIVVMDPVTEAKKDFVIIPKKDITDIGQLSAGDEPYLADAYAVIDQLVAKDKLVNYKVISNGPGFQDVAYLHFHLVVY